jgi:stalled ribosome rescue protein Dom34
MRIKGKFEIVAGLPGKVTIMLDNNDDLWHLYNIIQKGDFVKMKTFR